jgi:2-oxoglutarate ferredoxin oxidoreductase subunit beta
VTFNNHAGSTKSYDFVREHNEAVSRIDFISPGQEIVASIAPGETIDLPQPDGSLLRLRKLHDSHDPTDRVAAMNHVHALQAKGEVVTGLLYTDPDAEDLHAALDTTDTPLNALAQDKVCPGAAALEKINAALR